MLNVNVLMFIFIRMISPIDSIALSFYFILFILFYFILFYFAKKRDELDKLWSSLQCAITVCKLLKTTQGTLSQSSNLADRILECTHLFMVPLINAHIRKGAKGKQGDRLTARMQQIAKAHLLYPVQEEAEAERPKDKP